MKLLFAHMRGQCAGFEQVLAKEKPEILLLSGDYCPYPPTDEVKREFDPVPWKRFSEELVYRKSGDSFYENLQRAAHMRQVLVVKHRDYVEVNYGAVAYSYFAGLPGYDSTRINAIQNCREVSGKIVCANGLKILGLGGLEFGFKKKLRPIVSDAETNPPHLIFGSISLHHSERVRRVKWICSQLRPKLFIYGWYGPKTWLIEDTSWIVEAAHFPKCYAVVLMDQNKVDDISTKVFNTEANKYQEQLLKRDFDPEEGQFTYCL
jgi:hypothetical protein